MAAVWACLLAGYVPCLQPASSVHQAHKKVQSITDLDIHLLFELKVSAANLGTEFDVRQSNPDDEAILSLARLNSPRRSCTPTAPSSLHATPRAKAMSKMNWVGSDHVAGSLETHITPLLHWYHVHTSTVLSDLGSLRLVEENVCD
ncbi:hypothetical protein J3R83DRAFT_9242 [Lanmaoa asiatica]|nr:hypothetical protein J3R83DRAFT_9242 [Lanmaoa asiatica]